MKTLLLLIILSLGINICRGQGAHNSGFNPRNNGFKFVNSFKNTFVDVAGAKITTGGLCGGMSYTALDYYFTRTEMPRQTWMPQDRSPLHDYIYNRQVTSLLENVDRWTELTVNPFGWRTNEFFDWGLQGKNGGRLQELKSFLDKGIPVPLGLEAVGSGGFGANHQVIAIGYDCGRYHGDLGPYKEDFKIFCYNPNYPNEITTLVPNPSEHYYFWKEHPDDHHYITYFVDKKYKTQTPSRIRESTYTTNDCIVHELLIKFTVGGDDLRGGNDNCNLTLNGTNSRIQYFPNVNRSARWIDNTEYDVVLSLTHPVTIDQLKTITLATKHCEAVDCDNWKLNSISIIAKGGFPDTEILNQSGSPLKEFRGTSFTQTFPLTNTGSCSPVNNMNVKQPIRVRHPN